MRQRSLKIFKQFLLTASFSTATFFALPFCYADVVISEIMYDLEGTDTDREWVEIYNSGSSAIDLTGWKFDDGATSKHGLNEPPKNGGQGSLSIPAGGYVIFADKADVFLGDHSGFSGTVIDTVIDLLNTGESLALIDSGGAIVNSISYNESQGAKGDGNSLQLSSGSWIVATPTPGAGNANSGGGDNNDNQPPDSSGNTQTTTTPVLIPSGSSGSHPVDPQIFTFIKGEKAMIVGVESIWSGSTIGLDKKPIEGARYYWSFGDGGAKEGQTVSHTWLIPGNYLVVLETSVGEFNASSRQRVSVTASGFSIEKVESDGNGYVVIKNSLSDDMNISRWILRSNGKTFTFPSPTMILAGASVPFSNVVTGLEPDSNNTELFYPNGMLAVKFEPKKEAVKIIASANSSKVETPKSDSKKSEENKEILVSEKRTPIDQMANFSSSTVVYSTASAGKSGVSLDWILALSGIVGVGALGILFSKRQKSVKLASESGEVSDVESDEEKPLSADDFEIVEEKD